MKERPILFIGPMVRAILNGTKTQTRRVAKFFDCDVAMQFVPRFEDGWWKAAEKGYQCQCPYGVPGDRLWVKETTCMAPKRFATPDDTCKTDYDGDKRYVSYKADEHCEDAMRDYGLKWTPSIHMPRWASRITLELVSVRVERLQDISEADAMAEGIEPVQMPTGELMFHDYLEKGAMLARVVSSYATLWDSINGPGSWAANPWVWVVEFNRR